MRCYACGKDKDPAAEAHCYHADCCGMEWQLATIECRLDSGEYRMAVYCHACYHRMEPDMWTDTREWESLGPKVKAADLPPVVKDDKEVTLHGGRKAKINNWDPTAYPELVK